MSSSTYPVHVEARLDAGLSRWLWLVKWILVIPHYVVLAFIWLAFVAMSAIALVAILFTGRYPRAIFDFNVGVLRWTWRVTYYAYGALGTDRYPPFTLADRPDYPARLQVDHPDHLSRGLALVKWWLLAIPHYVIVGVLIGAGGYVVALPDGEGRVGMGLIGILVAIAAVALLFTGRYPRPMFDFVLGLNRWVLRVAGYAALMTDQYPPFRLYQGGDDPDRLRLPPLAPHAGQPHSPSSPGPRRWTAGRVTGVVAASVLLLVSLGLLAGGTATAVADGVGRDSDGFLMSDHTNLSTDTFALTSETIDLDTGAPDGLEAGDLLGDVRITATADQPLFIGIASSREAATYLSGLEHETVTGIGDEPTYRTGGTGTPSAPPAAAEIWTVQSTGTGDVVLDWEARDGHWTVVVMNADGTTGVETELAAGATLPWLDEAAVVLLVLGGTGLLVSTVILVVLLRNRRPAGERA